MRGGLLHLGAELRGRRAGGLLHVVADLLADALGRLGHRLVGFKTDAVGLCHQALFGIRRRVGHTGLEPTLPLFAKRLGFLSLAVGGFSRRTGQTLELESAALGLGSHAFLGLSGGRGHAGLEPTLPLFAKRLDFRSVPVGGFSGRLGETIELESAALGFGSHPSLGLSGGRGHAGLEPTLPLLAKRLDFRSVPSGGFSLRLAETLELESAALGFCSHPSLGIRSGGGRAGLQPTLPLFAKRLDFRSVPVGGFSGRLGETLELESAALGFCGHTSLGIGSGGGHAGLQPSLPVHTDRVEPGSPLRLVIKACGFAFLSEPTRHLRDLGLKVGLQTSAEYVDCRTKIVIGHFRHYRDGPRASQASAKRATPTATIV